MSKNDVLVAPADVAVVVAATNNQQKMQSLGDFEAAVAKAKVTGEWVEATEEIIKYFVRGGLREAPGLIPMLNYKGVNVCLVGQAQRCQELMDRQLGQIIHGESEARVVGR